MRALVLAAGLGTRLKPWTLEHPKALVPVAGIPMLERVLSKLENEGFDNIVVNIHHFGDQIVDYLKTRKSCAEISISDERGSLLDTGGGILQADEVLKGDSPLLVHNVDILSDASLRSLMQGHEKSGAEVTLLTSHRASSRKLCFDSSDHLCAWIDVRSGETKPVGCGYVAGTATEEAFSGIYIMGKDAIKRMRKWATRKAFPIMDFFLDTCGDADYRRYCIPRLRLLDIGKPDALAKAADFVASMQER